MSLRTRKKALLYIISFILVFFALFPIVTTFIGSILTETELRTLPEETNWFSHGITFYYYYYIFFDGEFTSNPDIRYTLRSLVILNILYLPRIMLNSFIVALAVSLINISIGTIAAYSFARMTFRGSSPFFVFVLLSRLIPPVALAVPYYVICFKLGISNTLLSVILIHSVITLPFGIWYLTLYFRTIPVDLEESAMVDGCSMFQAMRRISLPIALSGLVAVSLFSFVLSYNEFMFAQFVLEKIEVQTLPVFLASLSTSTDVYWATQYTVLTLSIIPAVIFIGLIWRYIKISELAGALKY